MMPASAPSCWMQGATAASYNEYDILASPSGGILLQETIGEAWFACQQLTETGILDELIITPLSVNSVGGASRQGRSKLRP
jgi:hypothetical protein